MKRSRGIDQPVRISIIVLSMVSGLLGFPVPVQAGGGVQLFVDTTSDNAALKVCTVSPNDCSLRGAIQYVREDTVTPPVYEIVLSSATYTLTGATGENLNVSGDLDIVSFNTLYITGTGQASTIIDANHLDRVLDLGGPEPLILTGLTLRNGQVATGNEGGAGIRNTQSVDLTLDHVTVESNLVSGTNPFQDIGGGIRSEDSTVNISYSIIRNNQAAIGGGLAITDSNLWLDSSTVSGNTASGDIGGGLALGAGTNYTVIRSKIIDNSAVQGGGVYTGSSTMLDMVDTDVSGNDAIGYGGGGMLLFGAITLYNVSVTGNTTASGWYGGGIAAFGNVDLINTTLAENSATMGGGIYIGQEAVVSFNHVTDANNTADTGKGSAVYMGSDGINPGGSFTFTNSIFSSYDPDGSTCNKATGTFTIVDNGYNLFDNTTDCFTHVFTDVTGLYAALGMLGHYGGYTPTLPLYSFSDAIDAASSVDPQTDQRRHSRKDGSGDGLVAADIGAFEYESNILFLPATIK